MEERYTRKEILTAGIALAILVLSANVAIPAIGAVLLYKSGKLGAQSAIVYGTAAGAIVAGGWALASEARTFAEYTGIAAGVFAIAGLALVISGVGVA